MNIEANQKPEARSVLGNLSISVFSQWLVLLFLAIVLLMAVSVRVRLLDFPLERDEGEYAYSGQLILEGIPPYQLACNMKMPGIYFAYATIMSIFGQTPAGIHLGLLVIHLATLVVLFLIAQRLIGFKGAAISTSMFALLTLSPAYFGLAAHATHFIMLPALLGIWFLFRFERGEKLFDCFIGGCFFGIGFLMKQPGMFFGIFGGLYLAWLGRNGKLTWSKMLGRLAVYSSGCLLPFLGVCLWLKIAGVFPQFWFWTISYAREYASIIPFKTGVQNAKLKLTEIFQAAPLIWIIAMFGLLCASATRLASNARFFLIGFLVFSFLAVCPGLYFRNHYFIVLLPAVTLLSGLAVSWSGEYLAQRNSLRWLSFLPFLLAAFACAQSVYADRAVLFSLSPREACRTVYNINPFPESIDIGRYIEQNTRKDQRIAVIGSEPQIYFYSHRHSSASQMYAYPLMEAQPYAQKMQEDMIREIEQNPPEYVVLVAIPYSWLSQPNSSHLLLDWVTGYVDKNMQQVGLIQFTDLKTTETVWGSLAATAPLRSQFFISVYKRKNAQ